jgi:cellulose synthase/poly-beta-1,6-N-acetylglucosamine synthase-like glycosyltransferase
MRKLLSLYPNGVTRAIEIFIPLISWFLITMPAWLSIWHPAIVAYFVITFDVYWFYKSFRLAYFAIISFVKLQAHVRIDWLSKIKSEPNFEKLYHVIIIPEFKEPLHILERTIDNLSKQTFPLDRIIMVLATETPDSQAKTTGEYLKNKYGKIFKHFIITQHTLIQGEVAGKSSNMAYAGKIITQKIASWHIPIEWVTITSCDADSFIHPSYLSNISYEFLTNKKGFHQFFQSAILFYSNIWRIPLPNRMLNTISSIFNLSMLSQSDRLVNFSTYTVPLKTVRDAGFWGSDVIPEDYHLFFKIYFHFGKSVRVTPIFLPIIADAAESIGFFKTFINQYEQYKRWAWGISDIPYVVKNTITHQEIPIMDRLRRLFMLLEQHILWPSNWFILTLGSTIPPIVNPSFGRTVLGHNLSQISSGILTVSAVFMLVILIIDWKIRPPKPKDFSIWKMPFLYLQWITLPVVSFFLSALPGLDAHTRLLFGKRLEYRVTEKV